MEEDVTQRRGASRSDGPSAATTKATVWRRLIGPGAIGGTPKAMKGFGHAAEDPTVPSRWPELACRTEPTIAIAVGLGGPYRALPTWRRVVIEPTTGNKYRFADGGVVIHRR